MVTPDESKGAACRKAESKGLKNAVRIMILAAGLVLLILAVMALIVDRKTGF
jgi:hypothetical protein